MTLTVGPTSDLDSCIALRKTVFIDEQGVSFEEELDGKDPEAIHILATKDKAPIGCARVLTYGTTAKIGRVCVLPEHRGNSIGQALIIACEEAARHTGATRAILGAQTHALPFYERLGYFGYGDVFDDAGIPHLMMERGL